MILKPVVHSFIESGEFQELRLLLNSKNKGDTKNISVEGISPASYPLIISSLFYESNRQIIAITENAQKMQDLHQDISCFMDPELIFMLPPWDTLPYEYVSPPEYIERHRITALYRLIQGAPAIIITTVEALIRKIPPPSFFTGRGLTIEPGEDYPFDDLIEMLVTYGYSREPRVDSFGQFSVKGGIIDIFLPSHDNPVRLDFFGDTLESIREFNLESQVSQDTLESTTIYPRKELILFNKDRDRLLKTLIKAYEQGLSFPEELEHMIAAGALDQVSGIEDLFHPLFGSDTLLSFISGEGHIVMCEPPDLETKKNSLVTTFEELYKRKKDKTFCQPPHELLEPGVYDKTLEQAIMLQVFTATPGSLQWRLRSIPNFHGKIKQVREEIGSRIDDGWQIIVSTGFEGQARRLFDLLSEFSPADDFESLNDNRLNIVLSPLREGIEINTSRFLLLTDHEIFGKSYRKKRAFKKKTSRPIESFLDLKTGDYVVHINHGIGIFAGIERMTAGGVERDFLIINYEGDDKLYVSLDQIIMVQKYIGFDGRKPRIDHLGKKSAWNRIKERVQQSVEEIAKELIQIYSKRNALKGFQYPPDTQWQEEFESLFEYEETPDQITAIEDVKDDMEHTRPMDRLICGDVGFGKTEVAIRAAFKSVMAGKQVALLVPTTVLAMQHFNTFRGRFSDYPITIDMMSRFRRPGEIRQIKEKLRAGETDIIIGTHALLAKDITIKNLGLLIIDEEQRFGVKHKEQLKKIRELVDVLTLTATPIPRTLHMSLAGIRDLSIITTPPENRQPIETYVLEDNPDILRMAITRELERDGQIFFVHNRVQTIDAQATMLGKLIPEAAICVAHGQMDEHELEEIMIDFINKKYDILISTTIIESGLDMPNVNTIIINHAETFGLSQLYQLKGRVGRSIRKAYAYLFYPRHTPLSEEAQKRLQVISEYSDLGSGFKIAMKDLEIRGAGNILGIEQSGNIMEVGFDLYTQMLENEVKKLKGEELDDYFRTPVFLKMNFFIPSGYISDERQKIEFYKRFESCESIDEVDGLEKEMVDRFGPPPEEVLVLIGLERIRALASSLKIDEILEDSRSIRLKISEKSKIDTSVLVKELTTNKQLSLDHRDRSTLLFKPRESNEKKLTELKKWLQQFC